MTIAEIKALAHDVIADNRGGNPTNATVLAAAIIELLGTEDPDELLAEYEVKLEDHNALLDEIESFAGSDSLDVKLLVELVKRKRPR